MPCLSPIQAYKMESGVVFSVAATQGHAYTHIKLQCGKCDYCRMQRSKLWSLRCIYEASMNEENSFITLTYANSPNTLVKQDLVKFMKRLRKYISPRRVRFFACGEYGSKGGRPHFHVILFGYNFPDKEVWNRNNGNYIYRSPALEKLWPYGFSTIGEVTGQSCAYVARYIFKKQYGSTADVHYGFRCPEYIVMSRRPGLAGNWFEQYSQDVYAYDYCVGKDGRKCRVPRYFDKLFERDFPDRFEVIKAERQERAKEWYNSKDSPTEERLRQLAIVYDERLKRLIRQFEDENIQTIQDIET